MLFFPPSYAFKRERVIWIASCFCVHVDHHQRQNHFFRIDLIDRAQSFDEMRWRIDMRSPLAHMREQFREKAGPHRVRPLVVPVNRLTRFIWKTRPSRNPRRELVREIDVLL